RLWGANINRRTVENVQRAGLEITTIEHLGPMRMVKLIVAQPDKTKTEAVDRLPLQLAKS
ncbi:MAG: hypothetical protein DPW09_41060, partial [Anaerolineae bacterium]|nr:hypothetical protein [Anaerolineae bacterium]